MKVLIYTASSLCNPQFGIQMEHAINYAEKGDDVIFLRKIIRGGADGSYGIHVAKLANLPDKLIKRASSILKVYEGKEKDSNLHWRTS